MSKTNSTENPKDLTEKWKGYLFRTIARKGHF
jgi:hypothetical protein